MTRMGAITAPSLAGRLVMASTYRLLKRSAIAAFVERVAPGKRKEFWEDCKARGYRAERVIVMTEAEYEAMKEGK